jgi:hypothetical protein
MSANLAAGADGTPFLILAIDTGTQGWVFGVYTWLYAFCKDFLYLKLELNVPWHHCFVDFALFLAECK